MRRIALAVSLWGGLQTAAGGIEHVGPEVIQRLDHSFNAAAMTPSGLDLLKEKTWTCDLFGSRTRMQVRRGLRLYRMRADGAELANQGSQIVQNYSFKEGRLIGTTGKVRDEIRMTQDGNVISRMSALHDSQVTLAFALCRPS